MNNGSGIQVVEENNYYPFGLKHTGYNGLSGNPSYQYKYNGKELQQESGMYDYGARFYMPDLGRWGVVDPLAETSRRWSTYTYAYNNPIRFIDPDGRKNDDTSTDINEADFSIEADLSKRIRNDIRNGPTFQFPKGEEEYYHKNYPAFYDFVKNVLPNIVNDQNFLSAFMEITGMSEDAVKKAFSYGQGPTLHDWDVEFSNGQYDYAMSHNETDLNNISISTSVLNWFEKANKNPNSVEGVTNLLLISGLVGHEGAHWGHNIKGPTEAMNNFINNFNGEHGEAFEYRVFKNDFPGVSPMNGNLQFGQIGSVPFNLIQYVKIHFNTLSKIFNH
jgi:RHS repeat-associated protein